MRLSAATVVVFLFGGVVACSPGGRDGDRAVSVLDVSPGRCVVATGNPAREVSTVTVVSCTRAHGLELYAVEEYRGSRDRAADTQFPGSTVLTKFANRVCAARFSGYVGTDYRRSRFYLTYLVPSVRSWSRTASEGERTSGSSGTVRDHSVLCFVTAAGGTLTRSVKGSAQ